MSETIRQKFKSEKESVGVVLLGTFNNLMFHPHWFEKQGVLGHDEIADVLRRKDQMICAPGLTTFHTSQLIIKVEDYRFEIRAMKEPFGVVLDAYKKIFEGLESITVTAMGINTSAHFKMPDITTYHKFGDLLAPKDRWKKFLGSDVSGDDRKGGLSLLSMTRTKPDGKGARTVKVERSREYSLPAVGIFVDGNDHFAFQSESNKFGIDASEAMEILSQNFETTQKDFREFREALFLGL